MTKSAVGREAALKWSLGDDVQRMDEETRAAAARKPSPEQERDIRRRLYNLGHDALVQRFMRTDGRLWNELVRYSSEFFVDSLMSMFAKSGYLDTALIGGPVPADHFQEDLARYRDALERIADPGVAELGEGLQKIAQRALTPGKP